MIDLRNWINPLEPELGWVKYIDCLDESEGLPSLPAKKIDLGIADPPFNVKFKGTKQKGKKEEYYIDSMSPEQYMRWCRNWFRELQRITKYQVIFVGNPNIAMWIIDIKKPRDMAIWYKPNCHSRGSAYYFARHEIIFLYGKFKRLLSASVLVENVKTGKNRENASIHPCPGSLSLYKKIIKQLQPSSVIDPFMGSGTTAEACIRLGIPYCGYEKKIMYKPDIDNRIKIAISSNEKGQKNIGDFF